MSKLQENNSPKRIIFSLFILMLLAGIQSGNGGEPESTRRHNDSQTNVTSHSSMMEMSDLMSKADAPDTETENAGPLMMNHLMNKSDEMMSESGNSGLYKTSSDAHAAMEGILLKANTNETVTAGKRCPTGAPVKSFDITAINIEITMNRFLQFYPGYMYVLTENLEKAREEERRNKEARGKTNDFGSDSPGLDGGDIIQPLVIRASQGDCVLMTLHNKVDSTKDPVSFHIHGSSLIVKTTGKAAVATNPDTTVEYGKSQAYEWYITPETQEGAHMFHTHLGREQSSLGMMGVFNVEPYGSKYLDPISGKEMKSGWSAMIIDPKGPDFREFTVIYHEVGDEAFRPLEKTGELMEQRDQLIDVYRPGSRALNYRSEPHGTRLAWEKKLFGITDESQAYGSYMFGDPATPVPRSYLGDPAKWRLVHGGSEIMHSHHLHGGADRWPRQPHTIEQNFSLASNGPIKYPQIRIPSDRLDVQNLGPSEVFDETIECGSGGCQAMAGEFLYHCHIQQHYLSGMWAFWRVYNSLQTPGFQTDVMAPLQELPDRTGKMKPPVDSTKLIGTTVSWYGGKKFEITAEKTDWNASPQKVSIKDWVEMMLPPQGMPGKTADEKGQTMAYDASVLDWVWDGKKAMNEKETTFVWPDYKSSTPGQRVPVVFDPQTGKLAWPQLKPHIGKRPPFAPNHGGAPFLEPIHLDKEGHKTTEPAVPGEQGPWSLCPVNAPRKYFTVHGIALPLTLKKATAKTSAVMDPFGQLFVLHEEEEEIRKNVDKQWPLVLRMNVGDCGDVIFKSEIPDMENNHFTSKSNMHPHFFQFDTSSSDGVISGFSYDQSVRPFTAMEGKNHEGAMPRPMNTILTADTTAGTKSIIVDDASKFHSNTELGIGMEEVKTFEVKRIKEIKGNEILFTEPLKFNHNKKEIASVEFVRYRWYPDVDLGIVYWHDHVFGHWGHGYFGSTVVEPKGSTYYDPKTGKEIRSGPIADIHTTEPVSSQVTGSFREMIMHIEDSAFFASNKIKGVKSVAGSGAVKFNPDMLDTPVPYLDGGEMTTGSGFGTRIEPLNVRLINNPDTSLLFSSKVHGDPDTPLLRAYLGDPLVIRGLVTSTNETHTWHVSGHYFPMERYGVNAIPRNTVHISIAERYDMVIPAAGGPQRKAGDYPYYSGRTSHFTEGSWGLIRVLDKTDKDLQPLPGREIIPAASKEICPADAPVKTFNVDAINYALKFNKKAPEAIEVDFNRHLLVGNKAGKIFVLEGELGKVAGGAPEPSPLTLHVNVGDCIKVHLKNETSDHVSFHVDGLAYDPADSMGINAGNNPGDQTVAPGKSKVYTFFAHKEWGENAALIQDWGNVISGPRNGLFGAIVIGPAGSKYRDPITGEDVTQKNRWAVDVLIDRSIPGNETRTNYRDFSLMFQDEDNIIGTSLMPYLQKVAGLTGVNYRLEPYSWGDSVDRSWCEDPAKLFSCASSNSNELSTPLLQAHAGDPVTIHVFGAYNEQPAVFSMEGHEWPLEPNMKGADQRSSLTFGGTEVINAILNGGAGGPDHLPGDYLWMNHRLSYMEAGQWGIFRVHPAGDSRILPLSKETTTKTAEESRTGPQKASLENTSR
jgi:FtsP/CotA-like multicopper oxidase with cupredoxin domain